MKNEMTIEDQIQALLIQAEPMRDLPDDDPEKAPLAGIVDRINALRTLQAGCSPSAREVARQVSAETDALQKDWQKKLKALREIWDDRIASSLLHANDWRETLGSLQQTAEINLEEARDEVRQLEATEEKIAATVAVLDAAQVDVWDMVAGLTDTVLAPTVDAPPARRKPGPKPKEKS
jgi:hypothetical protein